MSETLTLVFFDKFLSANVSVFVILGFLPPVRALLGLIGIGVCSFGFSLYLSRENYDVNYFTALKMGVLVSIPLLISCELITTVAKSLEIFRGSQLAEQLFIQERGGPIEFFLFLLVGTLFLSNGGVELVLSRLVSFSSQALNEGEDLQRGYFRVLSNVFPLAALGIVLELISGLIQRVSRKGFLGAEVSTIRVPLGIYFLISLLEEAL